MFLNQSFKNLNIDLTSDLNLIKSVYRKQTLNNCNNKSELKKINEAYEYIINNIHCLNNNINSDNDNINTSDNNINNINDTKIKLSNTNYNILSLEDIIKTININYEQSYNGTTIPIDIQRKIYNNYKETIENETLYIDIPRGIDNNEILYINNKGNKYNDLISNLKLNINLIKSNNYYRNGVDIIKTINITFKESLIGFNKTFQHINKKTYKITSISGEIITPFTEKILYKMGFIRNNYTGNLIIKFNIIYPKLLNNEQITMLKKVL